MHCNGCQNHPNHCQHQNMKGGVWTPKFGMPTTPPSLGLWDDCQNHRKHLRSAMIVRIIKIITSIIVLVYGSQPKWRSNNDKSWGSVINAMMA